MSDLHVGQRVQWRQGPYGDTRDEPHQHGVVLRIEASAVWVRPDTRTDPDDLAHTPGVRFNGRCLSPAVGRVTS